MSGFHKYLLGTGTYYLAYFESSKVFNDLNFKLLFVAIKICIFIMFIK